MKAFPSEGTYIWFQGVSRSVVQLQCTGWPDMEAPKDTKTLLTLINETEAVSKGGGGSLIKRNKGKGKSKVMRPYVPLTRPVASKGDPEERQ